VVRAFIIGGTGLVGRATTRRLLAAGWDVDVVARSASNLPPDLAAAGVRVSSADRAEPLAAHAASTVMISSKAVYVDAAGRHSNSDDPPRADPRDPANPRAGVPERRQPRGLSPHQGGRRADAELGYRPVGDYRATVPAMIDWLTSTAQLTEGAQLPAGFADDFIAGRFDYEREDAALAGRSRRDGVNLSPLRRTRGHLTERPGGP
jgi:NAD(P)-dependent dehydrogenase (short-subunit alcohol dehydrogenase family)